MNSRLAFPRGCALALALGALAPAAPAAASADADASRTVNQYVYRITAAQGTVTTQTHRQSNDGFADDSEARVRVNRLRGTRPAAQANFYTRRTSPKQGNSGTGSFAANGPFSASMSSPFGTCSDGYTMQSIDAGIGLRFVTNGRKVFVGFSSASGPDKCGYNPDNVVRPGLLRPKSDAGPEPWRRYLPVPKRQFLKRRFTLNFKSNRTESYSSPSVGSGQTTYSGTMAISFKRIKTFYR